MSRYVLDCSVSMAWCFTEEANRLTDSLYEQLPFDDILVPDIWSVETINILATAERRKRITPARSDQFLGTIGAVRIVIDHGCSRGFLADIVALSREHGLTTYDAAYLELARREEIPLATLDARLARAARAVRVTVLG